MVELLERERNLRQKLAGMPFYTGSGWTADQSAYAVANPALADALAAKVPIWRPPIAFEEIASLLPYLPVHVIDEGAVEPVIDTAALVSGESFRQDLSSAVAHFRNALFVYHADLHERIGNDAMTTLGSARLAIGTNWRLKVRLPKDGR